MSDERVAAVYARALFAAAREGAVIEMVRADLEGFAAAYSGSAELRHALLDPVIPTAQKERVLAELLSGAHQLVVNVARLLLRKGRMDAVGSVARQYERLAEGALNLIDVEVRSAVALPPALETALTERLQVATGCRVRVTKQVDADLLGGLALYVGDDVVVDASLRARLDRLRDRLIGVSTRGASQ